MDMGVLFERTFEIVPGKEGTFVVKVAGERQLSGERAYTLGFSNVLDLMRWLEGHANAKTNEKQPTKGNGKKPLWDYSSYNSGSESPMNSPLDYGVGKEHADEPDPLQVAAEIQMGVRHPTLDRQVAVLVRAIEVLEHRSKLVRAHGGHNDCYSGPAQALRRMLPATHPDWLPPANEETVA